MIERAISTGGGADMACADESPNGASLALTIVKVALLSVVIVGSVGLAFDLMYANWSAIESRLAISYWTNIALAVLLGSLAVISAKGANATAGSPLVLHALACCLTAVFAVASFCVAWSTPGEADSAIRLFAVIGMWLLALATNFVSGLMLINAMLTRDPEVAEVALTLSGLVIAIGVLVGGLAMQIERNKEMGMAPFAPRISEMPEGQA